MINVTATIKAIREAVKDLSPEEKFRTLRIIENCVGKVRNDLSEEWTYCCGCHSYVKCEERVKDLSPEGKILIKCGKCGAIHYVRNKEE